MVLSYMVLLFIVLYGPVFIWIGSLAELGGIVLLVSERRE